jgi:hypothetical protein
MSAPFIGLLSHQLRTVLPAMREQGFGRIVNMSSGTTRVVRAGGVQQRAVAAPMPEDAPVTITVLPVKSMTSAMCHNAPVFITVIRETDVRGQMRSG